MPSRHERVRRAKRALALLFGHSTAVRHPSSLLWISGAKTPRDQVYGRNSKVNVTVVSVLAGSYFHSFKAANVASIKIG
jgi:hypothetical protein